MTESEKKFISRAVLDDHKRQMERMETVSALIAAVLIVQAILWGSHCLLVMSYAGPWQIATETILVLLSAQGLQASHAAFKSIDAWRETYEECVAMLDEMEREEQCGST